MDGNNSFGAAGTLKVGDQDYKIFRLSALKTARDRQALAYSVLHQGAARKPAPLRGRTQGARRRHRVRRPRGGSKEPNGRRSTSCRRACCCRTSPAFPRSSTWRRCATPCRRMGADPKRANPLLPADLVIDHSVQVDRFGSSQALRAQRAAGVPAQPGALSASPVGHRPPSTISASCRPTPASYTRSIWSTSPGGLPQRTEHGVEAYPGYAGGHRLATPRWSTAWAWSDGAWAASRPRPACSASRSPCCCRAWSVSS